MNTNGAINLKPCFHLYKGWTLLSRHQDFEAGDCPNRKQKCPYSAYGCDEQIIGEGMFQHLQSQVVYHVELQNRKYEQLVERIQGLLTNGHANSPGESEEMLSSSSPPKVRRRTVDEGRDHTHFIDGDMLQHQQTPGLLKRGRANHSAQSDENVPSSSPPKVGRRTVDGGRDYAPVSNAWEGAVGGPPAEAAKLQMSNTDHCKIISDDEIDRLKVIFQNIFITRNESAIENKATKSKNSSATGTSLYPNLEKRLRDTEILVNQKRQELEQMKTLYAVLDKRNETFQEVVAVLNNQLEAVGEKVSALERQNRHLQDTIEQQERQLHAHDQMLTVKNVALTEQDLRIQTLERGRRHSEAQPHPLQAGQEPPREGKLVWKVPRDKLRRQRPHTGEVTYFDSPVFYDHSGYKLRGRIYVHGNEKCDGRHVPIHFVVMKDGHDGTPWPFRQTVTFMIFNHNTGRWESVACFHQHMTFPCESDDPYLLPLSYLRNGKYIKEGMLYMRIDVDGN
ncbi:uncharacterized protein [Amphiura filiformis]|uniref:uncharacterized protein n=1 Tax=Amphiura filiformis TaxID=82378 RepID=UPI003B2280C8